MNKTIIFSAPSGSGKTTLVKHCLKKFPQLKFSISATTRQPRGKEKNGEDYFFFSPEKFKMLISQNAFIEYEEVYENKFYGTLRSEVERIWNEGHIVIFDVDVIGGINLKKKFGDDALSIFIAPPSIDELKNRLLKRNTDDRKTIETRIAKAEHELGFQNKFDKILINDDLETAKINLEKLIIDFLQIS